MTTSTLLELQAGAGWDADYLTEGCFTQVARQVDHDGLPFDDGLRVLAGWASDARANYAAEVLEAARFDADH